MKEESEGFRISTKKAGHKRDPNKFNGQKKQQNAKGGFKVSIEGVKKRTALTVEDEDDDDEEIIEEDIQTDRDDNLLGGAARGGIGNGLTESGQQYGITASQSLGVDPSVDSLAIEEFDHIEKVI